LKDEVRARELAHHEELYSGFAQQHFAKSAVRALRRAIVRRILQTTGADSSSRVLSLGCGIGDTELVLAPHVAHITGIDLSPAAVRQARIDSANVSNVEFIEGDFDRIPPGEFDAIIAIFFLHHLDEIEFAATIDRIHSSLRPGGAFYSLDPNRLRLSGAIGQLLIPKLMARYQTPDEHELDPAQTAAAFARRGFEARYDYFDFASSPFAGLFPSWGTGYKIVRALDEVPIRIPLLRKLGSNFEVIARKPTSEPGR
jgi:SAM-dependent methyltransferase